MPQSLDYEGVSSWLFMFQFLFPRINRGSPATQPDRESSLRTQFRGNPSFGFGDIIASSASPPFGWRQIHWDLLSQISNAHAPAIMYLSPSTEFSGILMPRPTQSSTEKSSCPGCKGRPHRPLSRFLRLPRRFLHASGRQPMFPGTDLRINNNNSFHPILRSRLARKKHQLALSYPQPRMGWINQWQPGWIRSRPFRLTARSLSGCPPRWDGCRRERMIGSARGRPL